MSWHRALLMYSAGLILCEKNVLWLFNWPNSANHGSGLRFVRWILCKSGVNLIHDWWTRKTWRQKTPKLDYCQSRFPIDRTHFLHFQTILKPKKTLHFNVNGSVSLNCFFFATLSTPLPPLQTTWCFLTLLAYSCRKPACDHSTGIPDTIRIRAQCDVCFIPKMRLPFARLRFQRKAPASGYLAANRARKHV